MFSSIRVGTIVGVGVVHRHRLVAIGCPFHRNGIGTVTAKNGSTVHVPYIVGHTRLCTQAQYIGGTGSADTDSIVASDRRHGNVIYCHGSGGRCRTVVTVGHSHLHRLVTECSPVSGNIGSELATGNHTVTHIPCVG